jgi:hypothetical protein
VRLPIVKEGILIRGFGSSEGRIRGKERVKRRGWGKKAVTGPLPKFIRRKESATVACMKDGINVARQDSTREAIPNIEGILTPRGHVSQHKRIKVITEIGGRNSITQLGAGRPRRNRNSVILTFLTAQEALSRVYSADLLLDKVLESTNARGALEVELKVLSQRILVEGEPSGKVKLAETKGKGGTFEGKRSAGVLTERINRA